ncbi:helix-turn-helix domain-containing protein [Pasteurella multocida subsp. multocida]|uniref:Helix-turn-helix domain-containing protein n=1 Tax=Pasteurella multocida TaxID=747 RepID=A0A9X3USX4_PASMD|nr:helix-turn-helix domain-containing protein [Pasteurella multocida]MBF6981337.1 helix-turn-helix domain-containing protein [Pasteurella multocida]MBF6983460.1 helix-turn-helix domain-containing protein [Pasteurella multocida]MDA5610086.1 helix-turn-helix domain-containing protein [Pasteurella multocida]MDA5613835.1 helix-turn-helix domain-containing protein [Pasteurella multocida]MDA5618350.1 helix-turn-helix domain-containing protein [Pasteurella multocida subsp. multocida]
MKEKFKNEYSIGTRIKGRREELKLSRKAVCEYLGGVALSTLQLWEQNEREPQASILIKLGEILNISPAYLLTGENQSITQSAIISKEPSDVDKLKQAINVLEKALKTPQATQESALDFTKDEMELIHYFRLCDDYGKEMTLASVKGLADKVQKDKKESSEPLENYEVA